MSDDRAGRPRVVVPAEYGKVFKDRDAAKWERESRDREALREQLVEHLSPEEQERKLLDDLARFEPVEPPAEVSREQAPAEVVRRLEQLERQQPISGIPPPPPPVHQSEYVNRRLELLQRLRRQKAAEAQAERNREHERRCSKQIARLEGAIAEAESKRDAEQQRHRETVAELNAALAEAKDKLGELTRPLPADETTEDRLRSLEAMA